MKQLDPDTLRTVQKAWQNLLTRSDMLGKVIARHKWRLDKTPDGTLATNNRVLKINPEFWHKWGLGEKVFILAHEACHPIQDAWGDVITAEMKSQPLRLGKAQDYAVNGQLENDPTFSKMISRQLYKEGLFPSKKQWPSTESVAWYFERLPEEEEDKLENQQAQNDEEDEKEQMEPEEERLAEEEFAETVRDLSAKDTLGNNLRKTIVPKEDAHCIINWRDILRDFLWQKAKSERTRKRPSRRWDGKGPVIPGRASREFPRVALILDYSGSMEPFLKACAESVTNLICTFANQDTDIIACNRKILMGWQIKTNGATPTTSELLEHFYGGGTNMMPAIKQAKSLNAEIIFCVSDMAVPADNIECDEVFWITEHKNPMIEEWRKRYPEKFKKRVFDVLNNFNL